jgi:Zn-finger nucleic acid-binding protein
MAKSPRPPFGELKIVSFGSVEVDVCPTTGGVWLDASELDQLASWFSPGDAFDAHGGRYVGQMSQDNAEGPCPKCGTPTLGPYRLPTPQGPSDVMLDICKSCFGIWIDGNECSAIRAQLMANSAANFETRVAVVTRAPVWKRMLPKFMRGF